MNFPFLFCCFFTSCRRWNKTSQVCLKDKRNTFLYIWYWTENSKVKKLFLLLLTCVTVCILFTNYSTSVRVCYLKNTRESTHSKKSVIIFVSNLASWSNLWLDYCTWCYCPSYMSGCIADTQLCSISLPIYPLWCLSSPGNENPPLTRSWILLIGKSSASFLPISYD